MNIKHINYDKAFEEQHEPVLANVIKKVWNREARLTFLQVQTDYPQFGVPEWGASMTWLVDDWKNLIISSYVVIGIYSLYLETHF